MKSCLPFVGVVLAVLLPHTARAQPPTPTSIAFKDPHDLRALLDYRLPDWGYRDGKLGLEMTGQGSNSNFSSSTASARESVQLSWYRESEKRTSLISAGHGGSSNWLETEDNPRGDLRISELSGSLSLNATRNSYLSERAFWMVAGDIGGGYSEERTRFDSDQNPQQNINTTEVSRSFSSSLSLGVGLGRVRNVTPLIQAQRLNERLQALGRPSLSADQVTDMARQLARSGGFQRVFDRSDRRFWDDVFEPLAGEGTPLTPFEVFYLRESVFEELGSRREGSEISAGFSASRSGGDQRNPVTTVGPWMNMAWSRNLSLNRQVSAAFNTSYGWREPARSTTTAETGSVNVQGNYLWVLADRVRWSNNLNGNLFYSESDAGTASRMQTVRLNSSCSYYIEDRVSLIPAIQLSWIRASTVNNRLDQRSWNFSLGLNYRLGSALL